MQEKSYSIKKGGMMYGEKKPRLCRTKIKVHPGKRTKKEVW